MTLVELQARRDLATRPHAPPTRGPGHLSSPLFRVSGHTGPVNECRFSPDGRLLGSCAAELILWSISDGSLCSIGSLHPHKYPVTSLAFGPGSVLATASADRTVALIDAETGRLLRRFREHAEIVNTVAFLSATLLASGSDDSQIIFHDSRQRERAFTVKARSPVVALAASPTLLAFGGVCGGVFTYALGGALGPTRGHAMACDSTVFGCAIGPGERFLAVSDASARVTLFDAGPLPSASDRVIARFGNGEAGPEVVPARVALSGDGRFVAAGGCDGAVRVWDIEDPGRPQARGELPGHEGAVTGVAFHPGLPIVASGSMDGTVIVREL